MALQHFPTLVLVVATPGLVLDDVREIAAQAGESPDYVVMASVQPRLKWYFAADSSAGRMIAERPWNGAILTRRRLAGILQKCRVLASGVKVARAHLGGDGDILD